MELATKILKVTNWLQSYNIYAFCLLPGIIRVLPAEKGGDVSRILQTGIASDNPDAAESAILAIRSWLEACAWNKTKTPSPNDHLIREIGIIIASRRSNGLLYALRTAVWIFNHGQLVHKTLIAPWVLDGLSYLKEELRYDREDIEDKDMHLLPLLRWGAAHLALAMNRSGYSDEMIVQEWAALVINDPLPEVRYADILDLSISTEG